MTTAATKQWQQPRRRHAGRLCFAHGTRAQDSKTADGDAQQQPGYKATVEMQRYSTNTEKTRKANRVVDEVSDTGTLQTRRARKEIRML